MSLLDGKSFVFDDGDVPGECAQDTERNIQFSQAIKEALKVSKGKVVLDVGAGVGFLGFLALKAGAEKTVLVEGNQSLINWAHHNVELNGFEDQTRVICADASQFEWPSDIAEYPNIVTAELLTVWCVSEHQVQVLNNLHQRGIVNKETIFIPQAQENYISFAHVNFHVFDDIELMMPYHYWNWYPESCPLRIDELSARAQVGSISFDKINEEEFEATVLVDIVNDGVVNALYLTSITRLFGDITVGDTMALNGPITFPVKEAITVKKGEQYLFHVRYFFGAGYENFDYKITKK